MSEPSQETRRINEIANRNCCVKQAPAVSRQQLIPKLLDWYRNDPDVGIHSAIDWLLRHGSRGEKSRNLDWQQAGALMRIDRELAGRRAQQRGWYVTGEGQTFAVLRGPVQFIMGAPPDEPGRKPGPDSPDEPLRRVRIPRLFAIGTKEVTVAEFYLWSSVSEGGEPGHVGCLPCRPPR